MSEVGSTKGKGSVSNPLFERVEELYKNKAPSHLLSGVQKYLNASTQKKLETTVDSKSDKPKKTKKNKRAKSMEELFGLPKNYDSRLRTPARIKAR